MKKRALLQLDYIKGKDVEEEIDRIEDYLFSLFKPKKYTGADGLEVRTVQSFEDMCFIIARETSFDPKHITTLTFYRTLENIKKQNAPPKSK